MCVYIGVSRNRQTPASTNAMDQALFIELYPKLRKFAAVVADQSMEPDDLVQEALVRTLNRHALSSLEHPAAFLRRAILNVAIDSSRRQSRWRRAAPKLAIAASTTASFPSDISDLDRLTPTDRAVLYLVDIEGYSHPGAAEILDLTHDATRLRASRARRQLRTAITEERKS